MFLEYGVDAHGELVHVDRAPRGLTELTCPYCSGLLTAKKGRELAHHFAHTEETCRDVAERDDVRLPAYDRFNLDLSGTEYAALKAFYDNDHAGFTQRDLDNLKRKGLIHYNEFASNYRGDYELTNLGKIPFGDLSLQLFAEVQDELITEQHARLVEHVERDVNNERRRGRLKTNLTDLRIYRAQLQRVLSCTLYFCEIRSDAGTLYKVGVTNRTVDNRVAEIRRDLSPHLGDVDVEVLRALNHRGGVELYFKHRYQDHGYDDLGVLTEYFAFEPRRHVLSDLTRMGDKHFSEWEQQIVEGGPAAVEHEIMQVRSRE